MGYLLAKRKKERKKENKEKRKKEKIVNVCTYFYTFYIDPFKQVRFLHNINKKNDNNNLLIL